MCGLPLAVLTTSGDLLGSLLLRHRCRTSRASPARRSWRSSDTRRERIHVQH
jgi:hypothetical protein